MALTITKNTIGIDETGGGILRLKEVNEDGTNLSPVAPVVDMGYLADTEFKDETKQKDIEDETGEVVKTINQTRKVSLVSTLLQSDNNVFDIPEETRGKFYTAYYCKSNDTTNSQNIILPTVVFNPSFTWKTGDGKIKVELTAKPILSAISISGATLTGSITGGFGVSTTASSVTIASNKYYVKFA